MNTPSSVSGQGLLMIVLGVWLLLRTVTRDSSGRTLIDHVLGAKSQTAGASSGTVQFGPVNAPAGSGVLGTVEKVGSVALNFSPIGGAEQAASLIGRVLP
jgi:hypothetical protein